ADQRSFYQTLRNLIGKVLRSLRANIGAVPASARPQAEAILASEREIFKRVEPLLTQKITALSIRCHGDFHLAQVLYTGRDFVIIDFEGDRNHAASERRRKRSPLRDVAGMLRSFHNAAYAALLEDGAVRDTDRPLLEPWAVAWTSWDSAAYLRSYLETAAEARFVPGDRAQLAMLLDTLLLGNVFRELGAELREPSERMRIPMHGLAHMLGTATNYTWR
ncbi:MAG: alpha-amylase, partial [Polyangiaceae bacterium]